MCKEICICAAVKTNTGKIFRGHRHSDCIEAIRSRHFVASEKPEDYGFITSKNRYVDRKEGCRLQKEAGIESLDIFNPYFRDELYSEDLY